MPEKKIKWYKVAESIEAIEWQANNLALAEAGGRKITLARKDNGIYACAHKCPHAGGLLADGLIDTMGNLVCPVHRYKFNLANGRNVSGEGYYLKTYGVDIREAGIFVGFEEKSWLNIFK